MSEEIVSRETRLRLAEILKGDDWKVIDEVGRKMLDSFKEICAGAVDDHRFHQGKYRGLVEFFSTLEMLSRTTEPGFEAQGEEGAFRRPLRTATRGLY